MAKRSALCTQSDLTRLIKAALAAGIAMERITGIKLTREGAVLLLGETQQGQAGNSNEWDEVLNK